jgi:3-oxoacyl-[acyl-carrier protein] reductase
MDLGIRGRSAIVCASSRGLGRACAEALAGEGVDVVLNGRDPDRLGQTANELRARFDVAIDAVVGDFATDEGRAALLAADCRPDILVTNNAGPPPASFQSISHVDWLGALDANLVAALLMIGSVLDGMRERKFGRIINITSAMVTTPRPHMTLSSAARAGLTAAAKGISLEIARDNVTINNLLPERFDTDRQRSMAERVMKAEGISYGEARRRQEESIAAKRLGRPEEFGAMCAFLCSVHAGYISGNNIHLDGGSYPGLI